MISKIFLTILFSVSSAIFYRMGGSDKFNTKFRDLGCPTILTLCIVTWFSWNWYLIPCFFLLFGSLTSYFKKKGSEAVWWNWLIVGLMYSISILPYIFHLGHWFGFIIRTLILTIFTILWKTFQKNAVISELGEGAVLVLTIPLLTIN